MRSWELFNFSFSSRFAHYLPMQRVIRITTSVLTKIASLANQSAIICRAFQSSVPMRHRVVSGDFIKTGEWFFRDEIIPNGSRREQLKFLRNCRQTRRVDKMSTETVGRLSSAFLQGLLFSETDLHC